ncbi:hypothetical protein IC575_021910 [Cucumis melo]
MKIKLHQFVFRKSVSNFHIWSYMALSGGEMISNVFLDNSTFAQPPSSWALAIGEAIGLRDAVDYLSGNGMQKNHSYEIYDPAPTTNVQHAALCSFNIGDIHPTDIATFLDQQVSIKSGHHCVQPLHRALNVSSSAQTSLYFYKTKEDVDYFIQALNDTVSFFDTFK